MKVLMLSGYRAEMHLLQAELGDKGNGPSPDRNREKTGRTLWGSIMWANHLHLCTEHLHT